jgi:hypothetical protein
MLISQRFKTQIKSVRMRTRAFPQPAKTLGPSYYCLYSLFNKIRDKGKIVSAR